MAVWIELIKAVSPVLVASAWPIALLIVTWLFRKEFKTAFEAVLKALPRVHEAELGKLLKVSLSGPPEVLQLPKVETIQAQQQPVGEARNPLLTREGRSEIYKRHHGIFLTHVFEPEINGVFTAHIYLIGHKKKQAVGVQAVENNSLHAVAKADFYLGEMWNDKVFSRSASLPGAPIGITVSAYGPFLCSCLVTLRDGEQIELYRYIDFEMEWVFSS